MVVLEVKKVLQEFIIAIGIMAIGFILRFLMFNTYKYPVDIDPYMFLRDIKSGIVDNSFMLQAGHVFGTTGIVYFMMVISILCIGIFYWLCRLWMKRSYAIISSIFFALSPLLFINTKFWFIDKNIPTLFMILTILLIMTLFKSWQRILLLILSFGVFYFVWEGWVYLAVVILIYYLIESIINRTKFMYFNISATVILISILIYLYNGILYTLINPVEKILTSELNPIWNLEPFAEMLIMIFVFILVFTKLRIDKKDKTKLNQYLFLYIGFIVTLFSFVYIFRMNILFIPFLYLWFGIVLEELEYDFWKKIMFVIMIGLFIFGTSWKVYYQQPIMNDAIKESIDYINTLPTDCIAGVWSLGHIYQYYTDKNVLFKATSFGYDKQLDYFVYGNSTTSCSIILSGDDMKALNFMTKYIKGNEINITNFKVMNRNPDKVFKHKGVMNYYIWNSGVN